MSAGAVKQFLRSSLFRYLVTGGVGYAAEIVVIWVATRAFGAPGVLAVAISFWVGIALSFVMQKLFTFRNTQRTQRALTRQSLLYAALVLINYGFTLGVVALFEPVWGSPELSRTIALVITTAWNYVAYKFVIFRETHR